MRGCICQFRLFCELIWGNPWGGTSGYQKKNLEPENLSSDPRECPGFFRVRFPISETFFPFTPAGAQTGQLT